MLKRILKEPLLHFLIVGTLLFVVFAYRSGDEASDAPNQIVVDHATLVSYMQYRSKVFDLERIEDLLNGISEEELDTLVKEYVREEALYREAKALELDKADYFLRRRLIRQLDFLNEGVISSTASLTEEELQEYLNVNQERYVVSPEITFTHVFFSAEDRNDAETLVLAEKKLTDLNATKVPFHEALSHGDRFLYHANYVNKQTDEIESHFGTEMQEQLFALEANDQQWHGPFRSTYGYHLAMITMQKPGYTPTLDEVRERVELDAIQARIDVELERIKQSIVDSYDVTIVEPLLTRSENAESAQ